MQMASWQDHHPSSRGDHVAHCLQDFEPPSGALKEALDAQFGGLEGFKGKFNPAAAALQALLFHTLSTCLAWGAILNLHCC